MPHTIPPIKSLKLSFWLPFLVTTVVVGLLVILLVMQMRSYQRGINDFVQQTAHAELRSSKGRLEAALQRNDWLSMDEVFAELQSQHFVDYALYVDQSGVVRAATENQWKDQTVTQALPRLPLERLALSTLEPERLVLSKSKRTLYALILVQTTQADMTASTEGVLYIRYDLRPQLSAILDVIKNQTLAFLIFIALVSVLLLRFIRLQVLKPVHVLKQGMQNIAEEKFDAFINFQGKGEFAVLGDALERMAEQLESRSADLKASEARFRQLTEATQEAIVFHDNGIIVDVNARAEKMVGVSAQKMIGQHILEYIAPYHQEVTKMRMSQFSRGLWKIDICAVDGRTVPCEISVAERLVNGRVLRVVTLRDISERIAAEEEIRRLSSFDPLTGLANRHFLMERVSMELQGVEKNQHRAALAVLNINGFKAINDSLGMAAGDKVLRKVAKRLSQELAQGQILARVEGDSFAVLITHLESDLQKASTAAGGVVEQLLETLEQPMLIDEQSLHLQAVAGIVLIPNKSQDPAEVLREAETAMHQAKVSESSRIYFFSHTLQQAASQRLTLRNNLRAALQDPQQLVLHYQPQITRCGKLHGVEALIRWQHPQRGLISPGEFIEEAEHNGLIVPLGRRVMLEAAKALKRCQHDAYCDNAQVPFTMAVNVSPRQFRDPDFISRIEDVLAEVGVEALHFELELTESVIANDLELTITKMEQLRQYGIRFALDDFGTGYSSLSYLKNLPIDTLKIDRSFVADIDLPMPVGGGKRPAVLIDAIVAMAHQLHMKVLAEGVETASQLEYLKAAGCDSYQGYYFSKPLAENELRHWITHQLPQLQLPS